MDALPVFARLHARRCLVVGGGEVAARKVALLLAAGARVTVNAPVYAAELERLCSAGRVELVRGPFRPALVDGMTLIVAATDRSEVNEAVRRAADAQGRLVNVVDDAARCSFTMPAIVDRSPVVIAISTNGAAPVLARRLREQLERWLPQELGALATFAREWRTRVKLRLRAARARRRFWEQIFAGAVARDALAGRWQAARRGMREALAGMSEVPRGEVFLIGAGPGDADLLTLKALRLMQQADVVLYDRLASAEVLERVRRDARRIYVGKQAGHHAMSQAEINALMIELAGAGARVCRLKGGDPFVFGRGGEELAALREAGIDVQVVPGITAAVAAAAAAGIPLTHREFAHSLTLLTGHDSEALDWRALAAPGQTLAVYMGVAHGHELRDRLVANGVKPETPVAIVERATLREQRIVKGRLGELPRLLRTGQVQAPAMLFIGEVARFAHGAALDPGRPGAATWPAARQGLAVRTG